MIVIGIDPGSRFTGYGLVKKEKSKLIHIDCGVIVPPPKEDLGRRLLYIEDHLAEILDRFKPEAAAIEDVFYAKNWRSALTLGQARGAILAALARFGLEAAGFSATKVKKSVVGFGRAEKQQVQQMVKVLLGLPEIPEENAGDALAIAICRCQLGVANIKDLIK